MSVRSCTKQPLLQDLLSSVPYAVHTTFKVLMWVQSKPVSAVGLHWWRAKLQITPDSYI